VHSAILEVLCKSREKRATSHDGDDAPLVLHHDHAGVVLKKSECLLNGEFDWQAQQTGQWAGDFADGQSVPRGAACATKIDQAECSGWFSSVDDQQAVVVLPLKEGLDGIVDRAVG
jgi:hypothetical protein